MANKPSNIVTLPTAVSTVLLATNFEFCRSESQAPKKFFGWDADSANNTTQICLLTDANIDNPENYQSYIAYCIQR
ncbi:hypothetical protein [uncultured Veillonella sp.]|jgi:hypothetical protein|uniref:hypothetical protein n=1 Tax=uncultured Veillonella sp. TaxID=159268 RepID=UPI002589326F|nr:hypothetical protein [uncultured Veillonella sp.]